MSTITRVRVGPLVFEPSPRRVRAEAGSVPVAGSERVLLLWEEGKVLPVYLFLKEDVRMDLLRPSENSLPEAHYGLASYFTLEVDGRVAENAAWSYPDPLPDNHPQLRNLIYFLNEKADIYVDGERLSRPATQWSGASARARGAAAAA